MQHHPPESERLLRLTDIIGRSEITQAQADANRAAANGKHTGKRITPCSAIVGMVPMSRARWYRLIQQGRAPAPTKIDRESYWRLSDIQKFIADEVAK